MLIIRIAKWQSGMYYPILSPPKKTKKQTTWKTNQLGFKELSTINPHNFKDSEDNLLKTCWLMRTSQEISAYSLTTYKNKVRLS